MIDDDRRSRKIGEKGKMRVARTRRLRKRRLAVETISVSPKRDHRTEELYHVVYPGLERILGAVTKRREKVTGDNARQERSTKFSFNES